MSHARQTIMYVHSSDELYGSDRMLLQLVRSLDRERYRALVILPSDIAYGSLLSGELAREGIDCRKVDLAVVRRRYLNCRGIFGFMRRLCQSTASLWSLIRREDVTLVHSNTIVVWPGALAALLARRPHMWQVHELLTGPAWLRWLLGRTLLALSTVVVSNSRATRHALFGSLENAKTPVVYNGWEPQVSCADTARARLRSSLGIGPDQLVVGTIGRLSYRKGQRQLIEALERVIMVHPRVHALIVGGPVPGQEQFLAELQAYTTRTDLASLVTFTGFRRDTADLLQAIDIFVMPSIWPESFGLVVVEAMAQGKPVISSSVGALSEIIVDGESGLLVRPGDPAALSDAVLRLIGDPALRERLGQAARRRAESHFQANTYLSQFAHLYDRLLLPTATRNQRQESP